MMRIQEGQSSDVNFAANTSIWSKLQLATKFHTCEIKMENFSFPHMICQSKKIHLSNNEYTQGCIISQISKKDLEGQKPSKVHSALCCLHNGLLCLFMPNWSYHAEEKENYTWWEIFRVLNNTQILYCSRHFYRKNSVVLVFV